MATFERVPGKARNYRNIETGEVVSRRQYLKSVRGISNELLAKRNAATNPQLQLSRPARGRSSLIKKSEVERELVSSIRLEDKLKKAELAQIAKQEKALESKIKRIQNAKPKRIKSLSSRILKKGAMGVRVPFYTYEQYIQMFNQGKADKDIGSYGIGVNGYDESSGDERTFTLFRLRDFSRPIPEDEFLEAADDEIEGRSYFAFTNFYMHVAFKVEFVRQRNEAAKSAKPKSRRGR